MTCDSGSHVIDITYRAAHWPVCSPNVPGDGLPWDMPTVLCALGALAILGGFALYLSYLMWLDRKEV